MEYYLQSIKQFAWPLPGVTGAVWPLRNKTQPCQTETVTWHQHLLHN